MFDVFKPSTNFSKKQLESPAFRLVVYRYEQGPPSVMEMLGLIGGSTSTTISGSTIISGSTTISGSTSTISNELPTLSFAPPPVPVPVPVKVCTVSREGSVLEYEIGAMISLDA